MSGSDVVITPYRDGPLLVRGPFRMVDPSGAEAVAPSPPPGARIA